eukprot:GAHX01001171.1.p1 GENE.GAHX01001171.1~~GAHX01001171.1.p1  ORF type:complete len:276 (+),score=44.37 GAHX01001171.1:61-888(+)
MFLLLLSSLVAVSLSSKGIKLDMPFGISYFDHDSDTDENSKSLEVFIYFQCKNFEDVCMKLTYNSRDGMYEFSINNMELGVVAYKENDSDGSPSLDPLQFQKKAKSELEARILEYEKTSTLKASFVEIVSNTQQISEVINPEDDPFALRQLEFETIIKLPKFENTMFKLETRFEIDPSLEQTGYKLEHCSGNLDYPEMYLRFVFYYDTYYEINFIHGHMFGDKKNDKLNDIKIQTYKGLAIIFGVLSGIFLIMVIGMLFLMIKNAKKANFKNKVK